jgi:hypothetical protein
MTMPEHMIGFQVAPPKQEQQQQQQQRPQQVRQRQNVSSSPLGEFIVDDLKLFIAPLTAVVDEFRKQLKR